MFAKALSLTILCVGLAVAASSSSSSSIESGTSSFDHADWAGAIYEGYFLSDNGDHELHKKRQLGEGWGDFTDPTIKGYMQLHLNADNTWSVNLSTFDNDECDETECNGGDGATFTNSASGLGNWKQTNEREIRMQATLSDTALGLQITLTCDMALIPDVDGNNNFAIACGADTIIPGTVFPDLYAARPQDVFGFDGTYNFPVKKRDVNDAFGFYVVSDTITRHKGLEPFNGIHHPAKGESFITSAFPEYAASSSSWSASTSDEA